MNIESLRQILEQVASGKSAVDHALEKLKHIPFQDIDFAHIDHHRSMRKGFPEVIFGQGKTADQIIGILKQMVDHEKIVLVTRVETDKAEIILKQFPDCTYHDDARMVVYAASEPVINGRGSILVLSAGTSDIPVAREAFLTAKYMGNPVETIFDVGVAGIHRLFHYHEKIKNAAVLIVVAGMEGALPSVVAGLVERPVIAVPTSIGYGASFGGVTALLGMLNSCSSNVAVVNIDNGFGAGYMASTINRK
ncbi:MAG: nickel pincer cofactor biosynthesis protein LarB [Desulfobacteraceae bacterium]|nr:MAG: nickel pincer cofactor biosynthesis protein LarB [Desulfobacteraceae bacterium]